MSLWWLQPGWTAAGCATCGVNIWQAGGDPDHGLCPACWNEQYERLHQDDNVLLCDVCGQHQACSSQAGLNVCSEWCDWQAIRMARDQATGELGGED